MGSKLGNFGLYELKTLYFPGFWPKMAPQETKNGRFWAEMGEHKSAFFSKTSSLNCLKMHHNKVLGSILMWEKFGPVRPSQIFHNKKIKILPVLTSPLEESCTATFG